MSRPLTVPEIPIHTRIEALLDMVPEKSRGEARDLLTGIVKDSTDFAYAMGMID